MTGKKRVSAPLSSKSTAKRQFFKYNSTNLQKAIDSVRSGLSINQASNQFSVPRTTLKRKLTYQTPVTDRQKVGTECVLGLEIEKQLVDWLLNVAKMGFPVTKDGLIYSVKKIVTTNNIPNPFKNNTPGRKWFDSFMKRHPILSQKKCEYINKGRAVVTEQSIKTWFSEIREQLGDHIQILDDPHRVFNMDETAILLCPSNGMVLAQKGKSVYETSTKSDKENVTTLFTVNAAGDLAPPLTVYKYQRIPKQCIEAAPSGWGIGKTENGWMTCEAFYEYFANIFHPFLIEKEIPMPVVVFLDGHVSHLSYYLGTFCKENNIILCCLPPNTTHILQPLDVSFFHPLKAAWKKFIKIWRIEHDGLDLQKHEIPSALSKVIVENDHFGDIIRKGFERCGLCPFDENAVDYNKCLQKEPQPSTVSRLSILNHSNSTPLEILEMNIEANLLQSFKETQASNSKWTGDVKHTSLYDVWLRFRSDPTDNDTQQSLLDSSSSQDSSPYSEVIVLNIESKELHSPNPRSPEELGNLSATKAVEEDSTQEQCVEIVDIVSEESTIATKQSNNNSIQEILFWPKEQTSKKRKPKIKLPSVVSSDKWLQIMEEKENQQKTKGACRKSIKVEDDCKVETNVPGIKKSVKKNTTEVDGEVKTKAPRRKKIPSKSSVEDDGNVKVSRKKKIPEESTAEETKEVKKRRK